MRRFWLGLAVAGALSACSGGNPFTEAEDSGSDGGDGGGDTGTPIVRDGTPPGTASPTPSAGIFRSEPTEADGGEEGDGYATNISYDSATDTFNVDNLGFDGDNGYARGTAVSSLGPFAVYEADAQYPDSTGGTPINQFTHRAIYGVSTSGNTQFAIVRTGSYVDYGFGGFIYQRDNGVTLPATGQAVYNGSMAGIRDFNGSGGLEYTTADVQIAIDFDDFNDTSGQGGRAVQGQFSNRRIFDVNGNDITGDVLSRINSENSLSLSSIPVLSLDVGPGALDDNGEILGTLTSFYTDSSGSVQVYEAGNYYAVVSGDNAEEIAGVVVVTNSIDPAADTVRETGGFIVYDN
ncbi:hypothetical protein [Cribrihabitans pelagius]|uniref:hypothetical protein n=1 Tax=Cribrihabitans pelagius TaxID=1765746 RepID=UPI003B59D0DE